MMELTLEEQYDNIPEESIALVKGLPPPFLYMVGAS
jgi:hypothetical protein